MGTQVDFFWNNNTQPYTTWQQPIFKEFDAQKAIAFHRALPNYQPTPLYSLTDWAKEYNIKKLWLKDESKRFQKNTFKTLGASYAVHKILEQHPPTPHENYTFCTATDGNHGRSLAWAVKEAGHKAVIFVPENMRPARKKNIIAEGAELIVVEGDYDEAVQIARIEAEKNAWFLVQDTAWEGYQQVPAWVMAGYLTHLKELEILLHLPQKPRIDVVFLQAGVGSWAAVATQYYHQRYQESRPKIVIVEPFESDCLLESMKNETLTSTQKSQQTIMAGLNCGTPSLLAWEILSKGADAFLSIEDSFVEQTIRKLYSPLTENTPKIIAGESGAAGLAGFVAVMENPALMPLKEKLGLQQESVVLVYNTEGDTDPENFQRIVANR